MNDPAMYISMARVADKKSWAEARLVTVWTTFLNDAIFSLCNYWGASLALEDMTCPLPYVSALVLRS
jgi:hypothetical protein